MEAAFDAGSAKANELCHAMLQYCEQFVIRLDKEEKVDVDKATELLQQMGGRPSDEPAAVPDPESAASAASSPDAEEDPMEAVRRSLQNEQPKKP